MFYLNERIACEMPGPKMSTTTRPAVSPLILAGGKSTRMRFPKHLLPLADGTPLYRHQIETLGKACPESPTIYISLAKDSPLDGFLQSRAQEDVTIIYDLGSNTITESAGPAQALLSAFHFDPTLTWLVLAVDYPLLEVDALQRLLKEYQPPVTCFRNSEGFCEPLVGIWSPDALGQLRDNVKHGRSGPSLVVRELGGKQVEVPVGHSEWLKNVNTKEDWEQVLTILRER